MLRLALVSLFLLATGTATAEPPHVANTATPSQGVVTAGLHEMWRVGGDDDDVFFGNITTVKTDAEGNTLLLDGQLAEVHRIGPDGSHLGIVGREGDGPGEMRRPNDMFIAADGTICVLQGFPGRVVRLHPDGTPAGEATYSEGPAAKGQFAVMVRGLTAPAGMTLAGIRMTMGGGSQSTQTYFLAQCDENGVQQHSLLTKEHTINYADFAMDEQAMDFVWQRLAAGPGGRVIVAADREAMNFAVYAADGHLERTFSRQYDGGKRTAAERERAHRIIEAVGANYPTPPRRITVADQEAAVGGIWATSDGRVWVLPGHITTELPSGTWALLDVYDAGGHFAQQVALPGSHDVQRDRISIQPDGRCIVVVGALDAFLSQQAVSGEEETDGDSAPLEVICYGLEI